MIRLRFRYAAPFISLFFGARLCAECLVNSPGGNKVNPNRPPDSDVAHTGFSPLTHFNDGLPSWLCLNAGYRMRAEGFSGGNFQANNSDSFLLTRFRLGAMIKPTSWFHVYAELQDATAFWKNGPLVPPSQSTWDLRRAYVDLGDVERDPISFRVGRQDLNFGDGRLIGTSYWRNVSRGFDAATMVVRWKQFRVNAFAASPVVALPNGLSHHQQGNVIHAANGSWRNLIPGSDLEPFIYWRLSPGIKTEGGIASKLDEKTIGLRWTGAASHWDYIAEAVYQVGALGSDRVRASAWTASAGYQFPALRLQPRIFAEYDFASGDRNPKDGRRGTFDQLFPNVHGHNGLADQLAWQNLKEVRAGVRFSLRRNWMLAATYNDWRLASATDGFYNSSGSVVARDPRGLSGTHIGQELDFETSLRINRELEFGAGIGRIFPGEFLIRTNHNHAYTYPYIMMNYNFF